METPSQPRGTRSLPPILAAAVAAVLVCAAFWAVQAYTLDGGLGFPLDDSWIHLAFARSLADGHGLALDPGKPVAGSTAPLWTALASLGVPLAVPDLLWMQLLGTFLHLASVLVTWLLARELGLGPGLAAVAAGFAGTTGWLAWSALSGMEIPLFVLLSLTGMLLHLRERADPGRGPLSLAVLGVAALARPEGLLLVLLTAGDRLLRFRRRSDGSLSWVREEAVADRRRLAGGLALAALAIAPVALYHLAIGGSPLPTTLAAKTEGGPGIGLPSLHYLYVAFGVLFRPLPWMTFLAPAGCVALLARLGTPRGRGLLPALWLLGLPLAYACLTQPEGGPLVGNFGRYLFPLLPVVALLGALGLEPVVAALGGGRAGAARRSVALAGLLVLFLPTGLDAARVAQLYARNLADVEAGDVRMARWIAERVPPEAVVATMDVGAMAAILPNPILDLAGIGDPRVHDYVDRAEAGGGTWQDGVLAFVAERRPDYLMVFPDWLTAVERPGSRFQALHRIHVPGNVTLGRDTLVLYGTPWTRYPLRSPAGGPPERPRP